jgi:uncharacterized protein (DUF849 family)
MSRSVILEVALNGFTAGSSNPALPRSPDEIAADALRCFDAGAAIVHTHIDEFALPPKVAAERYHEAYRAILDARPDAILYPTIGNGERIEERYGHHDLLAKAGVIRQGLLDPGSLNLGGIGPDGHPIPIDFVYANSMADIEHELQTCARHGLGPSVAIFEPGFLRVILAYQRAGRLPAGALVKLYFSAGAYMGEGEPSFSPPPIPEAFELYLAMIGEVPIHWAVAVLGGSLLDSKIADLAIERGGHLRVGLEDESGAASNLVLVERAKERVERAGHQLASPEEAARMLGLPKG